MTKETRGFHSVPRPAGISSRYFLVVVDGNGIPLALTTCDNVFEAGGVGTSIVRLARGLSTAGNVQADIVMLDVSGRPAFNPRGRNGIAQLDRQVDRK